MGWAITRRARVAAAGVIRLLRGHDTEVIPDALLEVLGGAVAGANGEVARRAAEDPSAPAPKSSTSPETDPSASAADGSKSGSTPPTRTSLDQLRCPVLADRDPPGTQTRVRRVVAGHKHGESFTTKGLAEAFRAKLITAAATAKPSAPTPACPSPWNASSATSPSTSTPSSSPRPPSPPRPPRPAYPSSKACPRSYPSSSGTWRAYPIRTSSGEHCARNSTRASTRANWTTTRPRPSPGSSGPHARSARWKTAPSSATSSTPWPSGSTANPPAPNTSPAARRMDRPRQTRRHPGPPRRRQPRTGRLHARSVPHRRPPARSQVRRLLRVHVLRPDAPVRSRRAHQCRLPPARARLGPPGIRRLQPLRGQGLHRRRRHA
jgi:hypothetical protein